MAAAGSTNAWGQAQFGVDVGGSMGAVVDRVNTGVIGDRPHGYEVVGQWDGEERNMGEIKWLTGYDDRLKSEVVTWLWLQHIGSDFCSHSHSLCNCDLVNQVMATLPLGHYKPLERPVSGLEGGFPFITISNMDKVVGMLQVNLGVDPHLAWSI